MMMIFWLLFGLILMILSYKFYFILTQFWCTSPVCLNGKTAIVTGGCGGIGYQIAIALAARGCKVIVADKVVSDSVQETMIKETRNPHIVMEYVDFASFDSVRNFADRINKNEDKIDILINNVGMGGTDWIETKDGLNLVLQVNYYSGFLLTHLLVDKLKKSGNGRVIFTSSFLSFIHFMKPSDLDHMKPESHLTMYGKSKYLQIIAADKFAEKLKKFNITSNCWHPLVAATSIFSGSTKKTNNFIHKLMVIFLWMLSFISKSPNEAAQTGLHLAIADEVKNETGKYFGEGVQTYKPYYSKEFQDLVWRHTQKVVNLKLEEKL